MQACLSLHCQLIYEVHVWPLNRTEQSFIQTAVDYIRVPTHQGKVREIWFFFKVREKSGNSVKWSGKLENLQMSGKSQGILKS